jgi:molecular chaperone GrpE
MADSKDQKELGKNADSKISITFNFLSFNSVDNCTTLLKENLAGSDFGPKEGQKVLDFEFELNEEIDPMTLTIKTPDIEALKDRINLNISDNFLTLKVDDNDYYGYNEIHLSRKIYPQFTVGSLERDSITLWLKKQDESETPGKTVSKMIWCNENLPEQLEQEKNKAEDYLERLKRLQVDYQDLIVKSKREKVEYAQQIHSKLLLDVLEVQDNFERALESAKQSRGKKNLITGIEMIMKQLKGILDSEGVKEIDAVGKPLDPQKHEVFNIETNSELPENTVTQIIQKGYMYQDKILRLSKVNVSKPKSE